MQSDKSPYALVTDDDPLIRMDAAAILEEAGFRTMEAGHVDEAIGVLSEHHPSIVLLFTDVHMPGTRDGFALARQTARCWPHIAIVVASGQATPNDGDMPEGARFIAKPFSAALVHSHVREFCPKAGGLLRYGADT